MKKDAGISSVQENLKFRAYNPYIKQLSTDKGWRVEFDVSEDEYDSIKDLPKLQDCVLIIEIVKET